MELLRLTKERFDPYATFAHGFLVGFRFVISLHPVDVFLMEWPENVATTFTACTFRLYRTSIACSGIGSVNRNLFALATGVEVQDLLLRA
jgi:hypothetical protein